MLTRRRLSGVESPSNTATGRILKETSIDKHGKERDRLFLEALYYTRL
jgi:hypothetical protein